jgi:glycosyltransferase involved in cell wall biosynthesis
MTELVSIMMPAYNSENFIDLAIESVLRQTYDNWELIIVNDGSTDNTPDIIGKYSDHRIRVFHQENGGESAARNTALAQMNGKWVAFLDADDQYLPNHLFMTMDYLSTHPEKDAVYTDGYHINQHGKKLKSLSSRRRGPFEGRIFEDVVRASDVFGPPLCVVLKRGIISDNNLEYDTRIVIGPDWDFFTKYSDLALFGYIDQQTCLYRVHETNISLQVDLEKRAEYLAICRENAIKMESFQKCSELTRKEVFYDLLVNLLSEFPDRQNEITNWDEFKALPKIDRARLFRLMASKAIIKKNKSAQILEWLDKSIALNSKDNRSKWLYNLFKVNPTMCKISLQIKIYSQTKL